ncbi:MAG: AAA family ATPase, partial [Bacilli bacterium]|nr:AAA family ATPase [Bacilli bacterium]
MLEKLPCNIDDEKRILGSMLRSSNAAIDGCGALEEEDFINRKHQIIFNAIRNVHNNNEPVNVTNVSNELVNLKQFDNIGGINYLTELTDSVISVSSYKTYIDHVKEQSVFRAYLLELKKTIESYDNNGVTDISDFIGRSTEAIRQKAESRKISDFVHIKDYTKSVTNDLITMRNYASSNGLTGVDTGYTRLNQLTHGFQKTEMIILAARPSVGKTALGINIALNVAKKSNVPVGIFSLEMDASKITQRMIGALGCVDQGRLATGQVTSRDMAAIQTA